MLTPEVMISASQLEKHFGTTHAVRKISLCVEKGEAVGFLGPNGAGKTTTFRMLAGTIAPSSGAVTIGGYPLATSPLEAKQLIGYMPENAPLYPELTVREYLTYRAELKGQRRAKLRSTVDAAAESAHCADMLGVRIAHLSKGYRQRAALADALLGSPPVLLLDEPTAGLDPNQIGDIRALIRKLAQDHAILLSTHILSEVEATCSRAIVIHDGQVVGEGSLDALKALRSSDLSKMLVRGDQAQITLAFGAIHKAEIRAHSAPETFEVIFPGGDDALETALRTCLQSQLRVVEAGPYKSSLDEVFAELTARAS